MKKIVQFQCETCKKLYDTEEKAIACEKQGIRRSVKVGDIVLAKGGFGWFDGDERWISNPEALMSKAKNHPGNCSCDRCTFTFYYVITYIDSDPEDGHRSRYHLFTKAMNGKQGHRSGYTYDVHHYKPKIVKNPSQFLIDDSKNLIGKKANYLL